MSAEKLRYITWNGEEDDYGCPPQDLSEEAAEGRVAEEAVGAPKVRPIQMGIY